MGRSRDGLQSQGCHKSQSKSLVLPQEACIFSSGKGKTHPEHKLLKGRDLNVPVFCKDHTSRIPEEERALSCCCYNRGPRSRKSYPEEARRRAGLVSLAHFHPPKRAFFLLAHFIGIRKRSGTPRLSDLDLRSGWGCFPESRVPEGPGGCPSTPALPNNETRG